MSPFHLQASHGDNKVLADAKVSKCGAIVVQLLFFRFATATAATATAATAANASNGVVGGKRRRRHRRRLCGRRRVREPLLAGWQLKKRKTKLFHL
jgi:hypothetical protein